MRYNVGGMDRIARIARIVVGFALVAFAIYSGQVWAYIGVVPLLTGAVGFCPVYPLFKFSSACDKDGGCSK